MKSICTRISCENPKEEGDSLFCELCREAFRNEIFDMGIADIIIPINAEKHLVRTFQNG